MIDNETSKHDVGMQTINAGGLMAILSRPIAFHPVLADIGGSINAGLFLSQAFYWTQRCNDAEGWFYKSQHEWQDETRLTRWEQETARKQLTRRGLLLETRRGVPARLWFRVSIPAIFDAINRLPQRAIDSNQVCGNPTIKNVGIPQSRMLDYNTPVCGNPTIKNVGIPQSLNKETETTTETTTKEKTPLPPSGGKMITSPEEFIALYNANVPDGIPKAEALPEGRRKKITAYLKQFPSQEFWITCFRAPGASAFLRGERRDAGHTSWKFTIEFLTSKGRDGTENCVKVYEGRYADNKHLATTEKKPWSPFGKVVL